MGAGGEKCSGGEGSEQGSLREGALGGDPEAGRPKGTRLEQALYLRVHRAQGLGVSTQAQGCLFWRKETQVRSSRALEGPGKGMKVLDVSIWADRGSPLWRRARSKFWFGFGEKVLELLADLPGGMGWSGIG